MPQRNEKNRKHHRNDRNKINKNKKKPIPDSKEKLKCCKHCRRSHIKQRIKCPASGKVCNACNRPSHFAELCKSAPSRNCRPRNGVNLVVPEYLSKEELLSVALDTTEGIRCTKGAFQKRKCSRPWKSQEKVSKCKLTRVLRVMFCLRRLYRQEKTLLSPTVL